MKVRLSELPPQRIPTSCTLSPLVMRKTGEPLSPEPTTTAPPGLLTNVWQSCAMFEPETAVCTQVRVTSPCVQPVVRPTLFTTVPSAKLVVELSCDVIVKTPPTVRLPLFAPVVLRMSPRFDATLLEYSARDASL